MAHIINFSNQCSNPTYNLSSSKSSPPLLSLFMYMKHPFILSILLRSYLIRHSDTQSTFKDTHRAPKHSKHLKNFEGIDAPEYLRHVDTSGTQTVRNLGTRGDLFSQIMYDVSIALLGQQ